ncbi:hypothetical protein TNCV_4967091 [Trichonephila clavipes]|nr:hypothetical protein TNCV_4967091 [Trichonephila clavipes]
MAKKETEKEQSTKSCYKTASYSIFSGIKYFKAIESPLDSLPKVHFHTEIFAYTNKSTQHPEYFRQAILEVIDSIPKRAILIHTDGCKNQEYTGS